MNTDAILTGLKSFELKYNPEFVEAALDKKEEITPHLIAALEQVRDDPERQLEEQEGELYIYALILLGHFQEPKAHQVIIDLFSLPDPWPEDLFGDIVTEYLPILLLRTCGGSIEGIKSLILNKNAYEFSRGSAIVAMSYAWVEGIVPRSELLSFLGGLFTGDEAAPDSFFYSQLAYTLCDICPEGLVDVLSDALDRELVDEISINRDDIQKALDLGEEKSLAHLREEIAKASLDDIYEVLEYFPGAQIEMLPSPVITQPQMNKPKTNQVWNQPNLKPKKKKNFWEL
ncbi:MULTISPECIES: DUF1186 domain-containing protein [Pseudanabaena]|uniref:DUF1186 domain-containing protein n=2 Tax=Pseudanabaena TaxID=1152 RepID=L8N1G5_9CYAN|nr:MULTISPECIES: DUF1186 domain-containing protein [Pseudanabaena]ELS34047.1 protein of unknown function DUF1186 [Pseudanabaena biceps PCC 7429]MDG3493775.1 DUF1186 domain-containing protein [Pseudanabaena catenata USMAC16]